MATSLFFYCIHSCYGNVFVVTNFFAIVRCIEIAITLTITLITTKYQRVATGSWSKSDEC